MWFGLCCFLVALGVFGDLLFYFLPVLLLFCFRFLFVVLYEALAWRIPFRFGVPSRGPCGDPPRLFVFVLFWFLFVNQTSVGVP